MRGIRACAILMMSLLVLASLAVLPVMQVGADLKFKSVWGIVNPNPTTGVRAYESDPAYNGDVYFFIQNRTNEGNGVDDVVLFMGFDMYDTQINDDLTVWKIGDELIVVVEKDNGNYSVDHGGYIAFTNMTLDDVIGAQGGPTIELQKIPAPTQVENGTGFINISWAPLTDVNGIIEGYKIYRSTTNGTVAGDADWSLVGGSVSSPLKDLYFNDTSVSAGVDYYYSVKVVFTGYQNDDPGQVDNYQNQYFGQGSTPMSSLGAPPTVGYILIMDAAGGAGSEIPDQAVDVGVTINGFAVAYSNTGVFLWDVSVTWTITQVPGNATTTPGIGTSSDFWSGWNGDTVVWEADDLAGHIDVVNITINPPIVNYIEIVDTPGTGLTPIVGATVDVGFTIIGYAASFNNTLGYLGDISVTWTVLNGLGAAAQTNPGSGTSSTFNASSPDGTAQWRADDGAGHIYNVDYTINPPGVDFILIRDAVSGLGNVITDQSIGVDTKIFGWAAAYNNSVGYLYDISVTWSVLLGGGATSVTNPLSGINSTFDAKPTAGTATWQADDGSGNIDTVDFTILIPTVDYIRIVNTPGTGSIVIPDQIIGVGMIVTGYAAAFNNSVGYLYDIAVDWSVFNAGSNASTNPMTGSDTSVFYSGFFGGVAVWTADDLAGHTYDVTFTIPAPTVDTIMIVNTAGTGTAEIMDQDIEVGMPMTGYAASFNDTIGYLGDIAVDWDVQNVGTNGTTNPTVGSDTSDFYSGFFGGTATWEADDGAGHIDTVTFNVLPPGVDTIDIVNTMGTGATSIGAQDLEVGVLVPGYAAGFNATIGYIGDVAVDWTVMNDASTNATTSPLLGSDTSDFYSGYYGGTATWQAEYGVGIIDTVIFTVLPPEIDYIEIVDTALTGGANILDQTVVINTFTVGFAASFNDTIGWIGDVTADWSVVNTLGAAADTNPKPTTDTSTFDAGLTEGHANWTATYLTFTDMVQFDITPHLTDWIVIVDTPGTGVIEIPDQTVGVGYPMTGYAASFNVTQGYLGDVTVSWLVTPTAGENADTNPLSGTSSAFSSGTIDGSVVWEASFWESVQGVWLTDVVNITISPAVLDYILIVDQPGMGIDEIPDQSVDVGVTIIGYAASFNNSIGYIGDVSVAWDVFPAGSEDATTDPGPATTANFYSGTIDGSVTWQADYLSVPVDTVIITINPAVIDYIDIVDTAGTGTFEIMDQAVGVGATITGYAAGFNNSVGYVQDVSATWTVIQVTENATTSPSPGTMSDFWSGWIDGSVDWEADYGGLTDTVTVTITLPTIDYIIIRDASENEIPDQTIFINTDIWGFAAGFNNTIGFMGNVSVTWSVNDLGSGSSPSTFPLSGTGTQFSAGGTTGSAIWTADYGGGITDTVFFSITDIIPDALVIVDNPGSGVPEILDQTTIVGESFLGYAAAFSSAVYWGDVPATWTVVNIGTNANTNPGTGTSSTFYSGTLGGTVTWQASYYESINGVWLNDTVDFTVDPPTIDYITIVDNAGTGMTEIADQTVPVGFAITGYVASFNYTSLYLGDISVGWTVDLGTASTLPASGLTSDFAAGIVGGTATWTANDPVSGKQDTVVFTISQPTVDYILIVDNFDVEIPDQTVNVGYTFIGYAKGYNTTSGFVGDVSADWTVTPTAGEDASTDLGPATMANFTSGTIGGSVDWEADFGGMTDTVTITINPPTVDYITIVDTMDMGSTEIPDQTIDVGKYVPGYAAAFNNTIGYLNDVSVSWTVMNTGFANGSTDTPVGTSSTLYSGHWGGTATWTADDLATHTDTVVFTVNSPAIDDLVIVDTSGTGQTEIPDQSVGIGFIITGYAALFNDTLGYIGEGQSDWTVDNVGGAAASTLPILDFNSDFSAGSSGGTATWTAAFGMAEDTVVFTITGPTIDYVRVMDAPGGTGSDVGSATYAVEETDNFYLVGFNTTTGFVRDLTADWSIVPTLNVGTVTPSGHETNFTALWVATTTTCVVTGTDRVSTLSDDTGALTVLEPAVDSIMIMDAAANAGAEVTTETYGVHRTTDTFHAAAFNDTVGYLEDMSVAWSSDDTAVGGVVATGASTTFTAQDVTALSTCIVTAVYAVGIEDTTGTLTVLAPTIDYIQVEDAAANAGSEVTSLVINDDVTEILYAAGYNDTSGYVMDVDADWTTTLGSVAPATGADMTTYTPVAGTGTLTATYHGLTADVTLTVTDVTGPDTPTAPTVEEENGKAVITFPPSPPADVAEYQIQRMEGDGGTWVDVGGRQDPTTASYTDEDVEAGKTYNYRLVAYDDEGNPSTPSPTIQIKIPDKEEELPWVMLLLLIIIIIIIILLLLFLMTRKKGEEEEMPLEEEAGPEMPEEEMPLEETGLGVAGVAAPPPPPGAAAGGAAPDAHMCPNCGGAMEFIEDYDQYYCYTCGKYDSEFDEEGGEGGDEMPEGEGEPPSEEPGDEEPSGEGPSDEGPPGEGGTEFEEKPPEY